MDAKELKELQHDKIIVYLMQEKTRQFIKDIVPNFNNVKHFSDGFESQYKNKSFYNLCMHNQDYCVQGTWSFLATILGKSLCDGIGDTVKWATAMESKSPMACRWPNLDCWSNDNLLQSKSFKHKIKIFQPLEKRPNWYRKKLQSRLQTPPPGRTHEDFTTSWQCLQLNLLWSASAKVINSLLM